MISLEKKYIIAALIDQHWGFHCVYIGQTDDLDAPVDPALIPEGTDPKKSWS